MRFSAIVVGLLAEVVASVYHVPVEMEVAEACTLPDQYTISNFVIYSDKTDGTQNTTSFHFTDAGTGIDTACEKNSTSVSSSPNGGTARYYCENTNVEFIYQTTGIAGLTLIERACPDSDSTTHYEASGLSQLNLTCIATYAGSLCSSNQTVTGEFTSLNPATS